MFESSWFMYYDKSQELYSCRELMFSGMSEQFKAGRASHLTFMIEDRVCFQGNPRTEIKAFNFLNSYQNRSNFHSHL